VVGCSDFAFASRQTHSSYRLDIIGATTSSRMPHFSLQEINIVLGKFKTPTGRRWGFDVFNCPVDLFEYLAAITLAYKFIPDTEEPCRSTLESVISIGKAIETWHCFGDISEPRYHVAQVWRSGILLYLIRLFRLPHEVFDTPKVLDNILTHAEAIPSMTSWRFSITWPLFQAGLSLPHGEHTKRNWLLKEVDASFRALGCSHDKRVIDTLERAWSANNALSYDLAA
jgi:Fungal specific transcription factor domain